MIIEFDEKDEQIRLERLAEWKCPDGPRLGDFVRFSNGRIERFSCDLGDSLQTTPPTFGAWYLWGAGAQFSGSLNPPIPKGSLLATGESMEGEFWFFHHGEVGPGRRVNFRIPCRVFATNAPYEGFIGSAS